MNEMNGRKVLQKQPMAEEKIISVLLIL